MTPAEEINQLATSIVNSLDGKQADISLMSCLEAVVRIMKSTTGLTTVGAIEVIINVLSVAKKEEDTTCPPLT